MWNRFGYSIGKFVGALFAICGVLATCLLAGWVSRPLCFFFKTGWNWWGAR